jgi:hypothetical protein
MEQILLIMDGTKPDRCCLDFACYLAGITHSKITALFGGSIKESELPVQKQLFALPYVETIVAADVPENLIMKRSVEDNEILFREACTSRNVNHTVRRNFKVSVSDIIKESRFTDFIIINPETSIPSKNEGSPTRFVKEILMASECPVILAPYSFEGISEIAFPYDGSEASVFAIKQFTHLFPELNTKKISLIQVDQNNGQALRENDKIMALLTSHFSNVEIVHLLGNPSNELYNYLLGKKDIFVVMGAYGRNATFNVFKRSTAELSLETINLPFFIAHNIW